MTAVLLMDELIVEGYEDTLPRVPSRQLFNHASKGSGLD
jgi:hypothetical protein